MPVAWYIIPYKRSGWIISPEQAAELTLELGYHVPPRPIRSVALVVDAPNFKRWREVEVLGDRAIVKVNASAGVLSQLDAAYKRLPDPDTQLSDVSNAVRTAIRNELEDMGYSVQEINERLPNPIGTYTVRAVLNFMRTRRKKISGYDEQADEIVFGNEDVPCESIDALDATGV